MRYIFLLALIVGCTDVEFRPVGVENQIDKRFIPYVHAWQLNYKGAWPPGLEMKFGNVPDKNEDHESVGQCENQIHMSGENFQDVIVVEEAKWESYKLLQREALIFHELAHCLMQRPHDDEYVEIEIEVDGQAQAIQCPVSYMTTNLQSEGTYTDCRAHLYSEMFDVSESDIFWPNYKPRVPAYIPSWLDRLLDWLF